MVNLICNNGAGAAQGFFGSRYNPCRARWCGNLLLLWAYCCHKAVVKLMQPMYVWLAVIVVDLLAGEYLLRALVQRNHAEPFINA